MNTSKRDVEWMIELPGGDADSFDFATQSRVFYKGHPLEGIVAATIDMSAIDKPMLTLEISLFKVYTTHIAKCYKEDTQPTCEG